MKTFSVCYKRVASPKAIRMITNIEAEDFFAAVDIIKQISTDSAVIYFVIELPEEYNGLG